MNPGRETLTVVIPTKNAAHLLEPCLESVRWADEVILIDMHSTDETETICARYPQCRLLRRDDYIFGNVNHGFEQATGDWVMRLDTDERITPELAAEIQTILESPPPGVTGYECRQRPFILGHELRHGFGLANRRKMLFRRGTARYPLRSEHEELVSDGVWLETEGAYVHYNYESVAQYLEKMQYYTTADVERLALPERPPSQWRAFVEVARAFYLNYLKKRGYRDGWIGFLDAGMRSAYQFVMWAKVRERWERERGTR